MTTYRINYTNIWPDKKKKKFLYWKFENYFSTWSSYKWEFNKTKQNWKKSNFIPQFRDNDFFQIYLFEETKFTRKMKILHFIKNTIQKEKGKLFCEEQWFKSDQEWIEEKNKWKQKYIKHKYLVYFYIYQ